MKKITIKLSAEELKKKMNLKDGYTPIKGRDYFDGKSGEPGKPGKSIKGDKGDPADPVDTFKIASDASKLAYNELFPQIPTILQIEQDLPKLGEPIRDSLELLQKDDRLDSSAIKGLDKVETDILKRATSILDQRTQFLINKKPSWGSIAGTIANQADLINYITDQVAVENLWDRTGTTLEPHTAGDNILTTGTVKGSNIIDGVGVAKITVGTTEPTSPAIGDLWLDTN